MEQFRPISPAVDGFERTQDLCFASGSGGAEKPRPLPEAEESGAEELSSLLAEPPGISGHREKLSSARILQPACSNDGWFFGVAFSEREYQSDRCSEVTADPRSGFAEGAADILVGKATNQLWRNAMLAVGVCTSADFAEGRALVLCLRDDDGATQAVDGAQHRSPAALITHVTLESLVECAASTEMLGSWARDFRRRYLDLTLLR